MLTLQISVWLQGLGRGLEGNICASVNVSGTAVGRNHVKCRISYLIACVSAGKLSDAIKESVWLQTKLYCLLCTLLSLEMSFFILHPAAMCTESKVE